MIIKVKIDRSKEEELFDNAIVQTQNNSQVLKALVS